MGEKSVSINMVLGCPAWSFVVVFYFLGRFFLRSSFSLSWHILFRMSDLENLVGGSGRGWGQAHTRALTRASPVAKSEIPDVALP